MNEAATFVATPIVLPQWFDAAACDAWIEAGERAGLAPAELVVPREGYREALVSWIPSGGEGGIHSRLEEAVAFANRWYGFDLH